MTYNADYFIRKFTAIPEKYWCTGDFEKGNQRCVNGHIGLDDNFNETAESIALQELFAPLNITYIGGVEIKDGMCGLPETYSNKAAAVNNGDCREYREATPKQRILSALRDIKKFKYAIADLGMFGN